MSEDHENRRQTVPSTISTVQQGPSRDLEIELEKNTGVDLRMAAVMTPVITDTTGYGDGSGPFSQVQGYDPEMFYHNAGDVKMAMRENLGDDSYVEGSQQHDEEADSSEEGPMKLFVGQVPRVMSEEDLFPTFAEFGPIKELMIIRDKHTGQHRGCAFVTFFKVSDGDRAVDELHDQVTLTGGRKPLQVRPANENSNVSTPMQENKLFVGMTSRNADENSIRDLFAPFGEIREIYIIRNSDGSNKGCAFLKFAQAESAMAAIEALNDKVIMEGAARPMIVKYADTRAQRRARHGRGGHPQYYGPGIPIYPGFPQAQHASMAIPHYAQQYTPSPYAPHAAASHAYMYNMPRAPFAYPPYNPHGGISPVPTGPGSSGGSEGYDGPQNRGTRPDASYANSPRPREGPPGANLFIYHLPHDLTDADLATAFNPFGSVISAKVYVDKYTGESKGFGFVSYDSTQSAEAAIEQMNGFQIGSKRLKVQHKRINHKGRSMDPYDIVMGPDSGSLPMMPSPHDSGMVSLMHPHYPPMHRTDDETEALRDIDQLNVQPNYGEENEQG